MNEINKLRQLTQLDLCNELIKLRREQLHYRIKKSNDDLKKTHVIRMIKKRIARIKTIMTEKGGKSHVEQ